jgi:hypothetical protein
MGFTRVDPWTVADDEGHTFHMPSADALVGPLGSAGVQPPPGGFDQFLETPEPAPALSGAAAWADPRAFEMPPSGGGAPDYPVGVDRIGAETGEPDLTDVVGYDPVGVPADPYGPPPPPAPPPRNSMEAAAAERGAIDNYATASHGAVDAQYRSENDAATRAAAVEKTSMDETARIDAQFQQDRATAIQIADRETSTFLMEMEQLAKTKTDPSRYWSDASGFTQAAWVIGLVAGAISAGHDQSKNIALKTLLETVDRDLQAQEREIGRQTEAMKARGQYMKDRQKTAMDSVESMHQGRFQRLQSLRGYLSAQAKIPGSEQRQAGYAAMDAELAKQQMTYAQTIHDRILQREEAAATRRHASSLQGARLKAEAEAAELAFQRRLLEAGVDHEYKKELAPISVKGGTFPAGPDGNPKDHSFFGPDAGVMLADGQGRMIDGLTVQNDNREATQKAIDAAAARQMTLQRLRAKVAGSSDFARLFATDNALNSAIEESAGSRIAELNKGATSENDRAVAYKAELGFDRSSIYSKIVAGGDKDAILALIDESIGQLAPKAERQIAAAAKVRLPPGARITFKLPDNLDFKETVAPTAADAQARVGVEGTGPKPLTSSEDLPARRAKAKRLGVDESQLVVPLDPRVTSILQGAEADIKSQPHNQAAIVENAMTAVGSLSAEISELELREAGYRLAALARDASPRARVEDLGTERPKLRLLPQSEEARVEDLTREILARKDKMGTQMTPEQAEVLARRMIYGPNITESFTKGARRGAKK